jgi:tRNA-dihydrouridine synthase B
MPIMTIKFSSNLQAKIDVLNSRRPAVKLGNIEFSSPLLLAPMSAICNAPYRLLMQDLGAGGTVSELISCHGINYENARTRHMLKVDSRERHMGLQLFGEDADAMAKAAAVAQEFGPTFIDINMGCPVRKVVTKGGGSALMKEPKKLGELFSKVKKAIEIPLTIKIRTGWDNDSINAPEIIHIAKEEGVEFVAIHGRTRTQQYQGNANWTYLESFAELSPLPIIGNGDLHTAQSAIQRLKVTRCQGLMLGRGPLRDPFIFLNAFKEPEDNISFDGSDYWEIIQRLFDYQLEYVWHEKTLSVQMRKFIVWMSAGFPGASHFRRDLFTFKTTDEVMKQTESFFCDIKETDKSIDHSQSFMAGGHG